MRNQIVVVKQYRGDDKIVCFSRPRCLYTRLPLLRMSLWPPQNCTENNRLASEPIAVSRITRKCMQLPAFEQLNSISLAPKTPNKSKNATLSGPQIDRNVALNNVDFNEERTNKRNVPSTAQQLVLSKLDKDS